MRVFLFLSPHSFVIQEVSEEVKRWPIESDKYTHTSNAFESRFVSGANLQFSNTGWFPVTAKSKSVKDSSALGMQKPLLCSYIKHMSRSLCLHVCSLVMFKMKLLSSLFAFLFQNISTLHINFQIK